MDPIVWLLIAVAVAAAVIVAMVLQARSRAQIRDRFGPEYDRAVERAGSRREAEQELAEVAHRRDKLDIRELDPQSRQRFTEEWAAVQARFVDSPAGALKSASSLVTTVMERRGYPVHDDDERTLLVAADHPEVAGHYREAREAQQRYERNGDGDTEDLRQSFVHYRELFEVLVPGSVDGSRDGSIDESVDGSSNGTAYRSNGSPNVTPNGSPNGSPNGTEYRNTHDTTRTAATEGRR